MKFLVDGMLGKLSRWLRMLGQDVVYSVNFCDAKLLQLAKEEGRILLTRDLELFKRAIARGIDAFYAEDRTESGLLSQIFRRYHLPLDIDMDHSHCPICNSPLQAAKKIKLQGKLQPNTYKYYEKFWLCPNCGQIYWQGAHWNQIQKTLMLAKYRAER